MTAVTVHITVNISLSTPTVHLVGQMQNIISILPPSCFISNISLSIWYMTSMPREKDRHFAATFWNLSVWKLLYFDPNFTANCSHGSNSQYASISWDNGLVQYRQKAITRTNIGLDDSHMYDSLDLNELNTQEINQIGLWSHFLSLYRWVNARKT